MNSILRLEFSKFYFFITFIYCVHTCTTTHVLYGGQNNSQESGLSFYHVGPENQNSGHQANGKSLYPLSHSAGPLDLKNQMEKLVSTIPTAESHCIKHIFDL